MPAPPTTAAEHRVEHGGELITTIALGLSVAFVAGFLARRLRLPPIVGYLLAGVALGPFTPGLFADQAVATELAEIGVILLMFGVGIHFSFRDLLAVRGIAIPGAIVQSTVATVLGIGLAMLIGWGVAAGVVLGLSLSVASTVVLLRALIQRNALDTVHGRAAVGWLIVEDIFTVLVLVLLPGFALVVQGSGGSGVDVVLALGEALLKAAVLGVLMVVVGARVVPWLLLQVAREGSQEMFTLAVLAIALGIAFASYAIFGVSLALGAFLAGAVVGESDVSHKAAADALPLRDAFSVLFFVSVGMLLDPAYLVANPLVVLAVVALIVIGKSVAAVGIVAVLGYPVRTGLTVGAGLAQVGEFSFILATAGAALDLLPREAYQLVVAGALISITLNPLMFALVDPLDAWLKRHPALRGRLDHGGGRLALPADSQEPMSGHAVICGWGRVGRTVARALEARSFRFVVVEEDRRTVEALRKRGIQALYGDIADAQLLHHAGIERARVLVFAAYDPPAAEFAVEHARSVNPRIEIVARVETPEEARRLLDRGATQTVEGERELAVQMARYTLRRFGVTSREVDVITQGL
ncbi:MAG TPA: cation:proton antiporter, partial [Candidatus Limnocylindria bacterium]|nr:cation:proton antiporter [Candidatus Limnocylindria bacterium]